MQTKTFSRNHHTGEFLIRTEKTVASRRIWNIDFPVVFLDGKYRLTCPYSGWALFEAASLRELDDTAALFRNTIPVQTYIRKMLEALRVRTIDRIPDCRSEQWPFGKDGEHERV